MFIIINILVKDKIIQKSIKESIQIKDLNIKNRKQLKEFIFESSIKNLNNSLEFLDGTLDEDIDIFYKIIEKCRTEGYILNKNQVNNFNDNLLLQVFKNLTIDKMELLRLVLYLSFIKSSFFKKLDSEVF